MSEIRKATPLAILIIEGAGEVRVYKNGVDCHRYPECDDDGWEQLGRSFTTTKPYVVMRQHR